MAFYAGNNIPYAKYWRLAESILPPTSEFIHTFRLYCASFCPHHCTFCTAQQFGWKVFGTPHALSPASIVQLMQQVASSVAADTEVNFYFNDDDFLLSQTRAAELFTRIITAKQEKKLPASVKFIGQTRVTCVNPDVLVLGALAGLHVVAYGVESFSDYSLNAPELKKGFTATQAAATVSASLRSGVPITNVNLILFHPTITVPAFLDTVKNCITLLEQCLASDGSARLSLNCFPFLELYAGSPLKQLAEQNCWPIVYETQVTVEGNVVEHATSLLPKDDFIRASLCDNKLLSKFDEVVDNMTRDPRWPTNTPVDRSIGVNGLAMFIAAIELLHVDNPEFSAERLRCLAFALIGKYGATAAAGPHPPPGESDLQEAARVLSLQEGNVVFSFVASRWRFTCGNLSLPVPPQVCHWIGRLRHPPSDVLLPLRRPDAERVLCALRRCLDPGAGSSLSFVAAWREAKFCALELGEFVRALLVAPCGTAEGGPETLPLATATPHWGLEQLRHHLTHAIDFCDCRVLNPNLIRGGSAARTARLEAALASGEYDVVGFSFLPHTLRNDAPLVSCAAAACAQSHALLICGGLNIPRYPHEALFRSLPHHVYVAGPGEEPLTSILGAVRDAVSGGARADAALLALRCVPNLYLRDGPAFSGRFFATARAPYRFCQVGSDEVARGVALTAECVDIVNCACYHSVDTALTAVAAYPAAAGSHKLYVKLSDRCAGRCIFCSVPSDQQEPAPLAVALRAMSRATQFDCVHFCDHDLLYDAALTSCLCDEIVASGLESLPKTCKARSDSVAAAPWCVYALRDAGFVLLTVGAESFCASVLAGMHKDITERDNLLAAEHCFAAGVTPALDLLAFSPWETPATLAYTAWRSAGLARCGACVHVTPTMYTQFGDRFSRERPEEVEVEEVDVGCGGQPLQSPVRVRLSPAMEQLRAHVTENAALLAVIVARHHTGTHRGYVSPPARGLLFIIAACDELLRLEGVPPPSPCNSMCPCEWAADGGDDEDADGLGYLEPCGHAICQEMLRESTVPPACRRACLADVRSRMAPAALALILRSEADCADRFAEGGAAGLPARRCPACGAPNSAPPLSRVCPRPTPDEEKASAEPCLEDQDEATLALLRGLASRPRVFPCTACGTAFAWPPAPHARALLYGRAYFASPCSRLCGYAAFASEAGLRVHNGAQFMTLLARHTCTQGVISQSPRVLVDFGAGLGNNVLAACAAGWCAVGVDTSPYAVEAATRLIPKLGAALLSPLQPLPRVLLKPEDSPLAEVLPSSEWPRVHVVTVFDVLEHAEHPRCLLRELRTLLLARRDPVGGLLPTLLLRVPVCEKPTEGITDFKVDHLLYFSEASVLRLLRLTGFEVLECCPDFFSPNFSRLVVARPLHELVQ
eukprot:TRINITY_DN9518_c0_g1_i1.p1 TRINITY_DN9518_c0_g1~~TRINITY_DN9518_c0_g1_i1.p1  ORF type:complete len:1615 (-),score=344.90 TRINITY_DN9518_c0_g1_i1:26-4201(-)